MTKQTKAAETSVTLTDALLVREIAAQLKTPKAGRLMQTFTDPRHAGLKARLSVTGECAFVIRESIRGKRPDKVISHFEPDGDTVADAIHRYELFLEKVAGGMDPIEAAEAVASTRTSFAGTLSEALDEHGRYLARHKANPNLASKAAKWAEYRTDIESALRAALETPVSKLVGPKLIAPMRHRYHELGRRKSVYNEACHIRTMLSLNHRTKLFPKPLVDFLMSDELRKEFKMPAKSVESVSLREEKPAKFAKGWQFLIDNVRNGYACTHAAAIMTGAHQAEISKMRGDWIEVIDGDRYCHFPGEVMKGKDQLNPAVAARNDSWVYLTPRMWALLVAHREAAGVAVDDPGPVWMQPGKSKNGPRVPIIEASPNTAVRTNVRLYAAVRELAEIEDWGQQVFRRTFVSVALDGGAAPHDVELSINHKLKGVTQAHYVDPGKRAADQRRASRTCALLVEAWLAKMLGETGGNVRSLERSRR